MVSYKHIEEFAGGGGASLGYHLATGRIVDVAVNHDRDACAMHRINHRQTIHHKKSVWEVDPLTVLRDLGFTESEIRIVRFLIDSGWFSPDCKHFSKAKGASLYDKRIRGLAYLMVKWAGRGGAVRVAHGKFGRVRRRGPACPRTMFFENVEEFKTWGPLIARRDKKTGRVVKSDGTVAAPGELVRYRDQWLVPDPRRRGLYYRRWIRQLEEVGGVHRFAEERACDFGAPTIRKRLYGVIRFDGQPVSWPAPTHADPKSDQVKAGILKPWRVAAEIIDWTIPCPSIFLGRKAARRVGAVRPLAHATLERIARGVERYILKAAQPFIVNLTHQGNDGVEDLGAPLKTVTAANRGEKALVAPIVAYAQHGGGVRPATAPMHTVAASAKDQNQVLTAHVVKLRGDNVGHSMASPAHTVSAGGNHLGVVAAFLAQHNSGMVGHDAREPVSTIVGKGSNQAVVYAALMKYFSTPQDPRLNEPLHTVTTKDRFSLLATDSRIPPLTPELAAKARRVAKFLRRFGVKIEGEYAMVGEYIIVDIGMRMFVPRELFRAQSFPDSYIIDRGIDVINGKLVEIPLTRTAQVKMCGNSVCPLMAEAFIRANASGIEDAQGLAA